MNFLKNTKKEYIAASVFAVLILAFYGNTLFNGYVQDDVGQVESNANLRSVKNLPKVITSCIWEYANKGCKGRTFYYRPLHYLSYFLTYQISPQPWIFHLVNLIYFSIVIFLIFKLVTIITKDFFLSFFSALIFLIHPVNSEVVNWVSAGSELLFTIFVLLGAIYYIAYRDKNSIRNFVLACAFFFLALLSKETAVILPFIFLSIDLIFFEIKIKNLFKWNEIKKYLIFVILFFVYFFARLSVIGGGSYLGSLTLSERIYTTVVLFAKYLGKLFYPYPLQIIDGFKVDANLGSSVFFVSLSATLIFIVFSIAMARKRRNLLLFSMIWFIVFLAPAIVFLQAAGAGTGMFFERYLFVPSIGFALTLAYLLCHVLKIQDYLFKKSVRSAVLWLIVGLTVAGCWYIIFQRNQAWKSNETLYMDTLRRVPHAQNIRYALGSYYFERGELDKARTEFETVINSGDQWKDITMAYKGLGDYYRTKNDLDNALIYYQKSVDAAVPTPRDYVTFNDLGVAYMDKGVYLKGLIYFCQAVQLLPDNQTTMNNLNGAVSAVESNYKEKKILYNKIVEDLALSIEPKIQYIDKRCSEDLCQYGFSFRSDRPEILPPMLISAAALPEKEEIAIDNPSYNAEQGIITIEIDKKYSSKNIDFLFPNCQGIYYNSEVRPN